MWGILPNSALLLLKVFRDQGIAQLPHSHDPLEESLVFFFSFIYFNRKTANDVKAMINYGSDSGVKKIQCSVIQRKSKQEQIYQYRKSFTQHI